MTVAISPYQPIKIKIMTREDYLKYTNLWDEVWSNVAKRQRWTDDTDPGEHVYIDIEPYKWGFDTIDSVLVFADGTVEFHLVNEGVAFYWALWSKEVVDDILKAVVK